LRKAKTAQIAESQRKFSFNSLGGIGGKSVQLNAEIVAGLSLHERKKWR